MSVRRPCSRAAIVLFTSSDHLSFCPFSICSVVASLFIIKLNLICSLISSFQVRTLASRSSVIILATLNCWEKWEPLWMAIAMSLPYLLARMGLALFPGYVERQCLINSPFESTLWSFHYQMQLCVACSKETLGPR